MLLYLTPTERSLFDKLPANLKKAWGGTVEEEKGTAWETEEQLVSRVQYLQQSMPTKLKIGAQKTFITLQAKGFDSLSAQDFPKKVIPYAFMAMGAVGLT